MLISILNAQNRKTGTYVPKLYAAKMYASKTGRVLTIISNMKFYRYREFPLPYIKMLEGTETNYARGCTQWFDSLIWGKNYFCPATAASRSLSHWANAIRVS